MLQNPTPIAEPTGGLFASAPERPQVDPFGNALAIYLTSILERWRGQCEPQYQIFIENYRDREMISEDGDTVGSGIPRATKGKSIVIGSTRNKIRSGTSLTADSMRSNAKYPFDISTPVKSLEPHAFWFKRILDRVQDEMGMWTLLDKVNLSAGTYGDGFLLGPFSITKTYEKAVDAQFVRLGDKIRAIPIKESVRFKLPQFRYGNNMDIVPDPTASDLNGPLQMLQPEQVQELMLETTPDGEPVYRDLDRVLQVGRIDPSDAMQGNDRLKQLRANIVYFTPEGQIAHHVYAGPVPINALAAWMGRDEAKLRSDFKLDPHDPSTYRIEAIVDIMGGIVVRAQINQWHCQRRPGSKFPWERIEDQFYSRGIAVNNAAAQKIQTAAVRMWIESKSLSLLAPIVYNPDMFIAGQSFKFTPNKALKLKSWVRSAEMAKAAFSKLEIPDVSNGWAEFYELGERLSDIGTGQNQYMQGNPQASHLNPTATGVSLLMGAAQSPMKSVMMNFDQFYQDVMDGLIDWCIKFLDPQLVAYWFGNQPVEGTVTEQNPEGFTVSDLWEQIQQAGMLSMFVMKPTGLMTFERKSIVFQKVSLLWQIFNQSPAAQQIIKGADFARLLWKMADTGEEAPIKTQSELDQMLALAEQARQEEMDLRRKETAADAQVKLAAQGMDAEAKIQVAKINADAKAKALPAKTE
jgi:hypothetical protein